jgi:hypothetical protein
VIDSLLPTSEHLRRLEFRRNLIIYQPSPYCEKWRIKKNDLANCPPVAFVGDLTGTSVFISNSSIAACMTQCAREKSRGFSATMSIAIRKG